MKTQNLKKAIKFKAVRSSGKGGQHVNKVSSKVELMFDIAASTYSKSEQKRIKTFLATRISSDGILRITCQEGRSQLLNRKKAIAKLEKLLKKALYIEKKRIPTKPTKGMVEHRLQKKRIQSEKKAMRKKVNPIIRD